MSNARLAYGASRRNVEKINLFEMSTCKICRKKKANRRNSLYTATLSTQTTRKQKNCQLHGGKIQ
jgi:hypothetical protein